MRAPILRFAEFTDDWEETTLENLAEVERGKFSVRPRNDPRYFGGEMPFVQTGDVTGSDMYLKGYSQTLNADGIKVSKVFPADTILITIAANIGDTTITQYAVACPDSVVAIQAKKDLANTIFLKNLIDLQKENLDSQATQNAQKNINLQVLKPLQLIAPSKAEQTKIATFLSAVDEKISQLSQKLHLLGQYKQGMMQKLFSQQIRFKVDDGSEFGEWKSIQLKDIAERITRKNKEENQNALTISAQMGLVNQQEYFSKQIASRDLSKYYLLHKGEYAYNKSYSAGYPMGAIKRLKLYDKGVVSTLYICFSLNKHINSDFFQQYVESGALVPELEKIAQEGARNHGLLNISLQEFFEVNLWTPCLEEQTKIANFLSSIDKKIDVISEQLEQAKLWKKGLLQQMFV